jgi:hypothetical protein
MTELKRNILLHWALQPPTYQTLKPIAELLCSIQTVFPPAFGVGGHAYFDGWQTITESQLLLLKNSSSSDNNNSNNNNNNNNNNNSNNSNGGEAIKKAVRKLRFFLHPDKLPRDLTEAQAFTCKLLWDVTNDAFEENKTSLETLDWINN